MYSPAELSWHFEIISLAANPDQMNNIAMAANADNIMPPMILKVRIAASPRCKSHMILHRVPQAHPIPV
jgi:hypothetical protein